MRIANRVAVAAAVVLMAASASACSKGGWARWSDPELGVSVDFPGARPTLKREARMTPRGPQAVTTVEAKGGGRFYSVQIIADPATTGDAQAVLDAAVAGAGRHGRWVRDVKTITVDGAPGRDFVAGSTEARGSVHARTRVLLRNGILYNASAIGEGEQPSRMDEAFVQSLRLTEPKPQGAPK